MTASGKIAIKNIAVTIKIASTAIARAIAKAIATATATATAKSNTHESSNLSDLATANPSYFGIRSHLSILYNLTNPSIAKNTLAIMILAGVLFSAVAIFLGIFTKLPQGGGGLINNLMVMSCFYSTPPLLHPPPPPTASLFDLDAAKTRQNYLHYPSSPTGNFTNGPMPSPVARHRAAADSKNPLPSNATFPLPYFSFLSFSPLSQFYQLLAMIGEAIARIVTLLLALCSPWLVARQMYLLEMTVSARQAASKPLVIAAKFEQEFWQIQCYDSLIDDLRIARAERDEALVELRQIREGAEEVGLRALERDRENGERMNELRKELDDVSLDFATGKINLVKLQKEMEGEVEGFKKEIRKQGKAWEEEKKAWMEKKERDEKKNQEEKDSLKMERDSWKRQVDRLEMEKKSEKEEMRMKLRNISEGMKKERKRWTEEMEAWKKGREEEAKKNEKIEAERKDEGVKAKEEILFWEKANDRARWRIVELENENTRLRKEALEQKKPGIECEATRKTFEEAKAEEWKRREDDIRAEAKNETSKLEKEVLNGHKLIDDLQSDKRRDRQLLLELRAQLVRPTHAVPPNHINPHRFGGSAQAAYGAPTVAISSNTLSTNPPASPKRTITTIFPSNPPQFSLPNIPSTKAVKQGLDLQLGPLPPRPIVRLPPPPPTRRIIPAQPSALNFPPPNAPKGPKGWNPSEEPGGSR